MKCLLLLLLLGTFVSCSVTQIKKGEQYTGQSMDLLRDGESIHALLKEGKLAIMVTAKDGSKCTGSFEYTTSSRSYLGFTMASNDYVGSFNKPLSKSCQSAVGSEGGNKITVQVARMGGMLGSSVMSTLTIRICEDAEGVCMPKNTFKVVKN